MDIYDNGKNVESFLENWNKMEVILRIRKRSLKLLLYIKFDAVLLEHLTKKQHLLYILAKSIISNTDISNGFVLNFSGPFTKNKITDV